MRDDLEQDDLESTYSPLNTLIRIDDNLFIHSPIPLPPSLHLEIEAIGQLRWIIGPNRLHYWWIRDWISAFPEAGAYLAPRIEEQARGRIDFPHRALDETRDYPWDDAVWHTIPAKPHG